MSRNVPNAQAALKRFLLSVTHEVSAYVRDMQANRRIALQHASLAILLIGSGTMLSFVVASTIGASGLLFLSGPSQEIIPQSALVDRSTLGVGEATSKALRFRAPFTLFLTKPTRVKSTIHVAVAAPDGTLTTSPLLTQYDTFTPVGTAHVLHSASIAPWNDKSAERREARLRAAQSDSSHAEPVTDSATSGMSLTSNLVSRTLRSMLIALAPGRDGQVLTIEKGRLVWKNIEDLAQNIAISGSGRKPNTQIGAGSIERHYAGGSSS